MVQSEEFVHGHLICAIVTPNYLNQFLILGESIARAMPSADLRVLILQDCADTGNIQEKIDHYLAAVGSSANNQAIKMDRWDGKTSTLNRHLSFTTSWSLLHRSSQHYCVIFFARIGNESRTWTPIFNCSKILRPCWT